MKMRTTPCLDVKGRQATSTNEGRLDVHVSATPSLDSDLAMVSKTLKSRFQRPSVSRSYLVPMLVKAFRIIDVLQENHRPFTVDELSRKLGYSKSTVYRILRTLTAYGYLPDSTSGTCATRITKS